MKFHYSKKENALYLRFNENKYVESDEVKEGVIFDYDKDGRIIGIEVLNASERFPSEFTKAIEAEKLPLDLVIEQK